MNVFIKLLFFGASILSVKGQGTYVYPESTRNGNENWTIVHLPLMSLFNCPVVADYGVQNTINNRYLSELNAYVAWKNEANAALKPLEDTVVSTNATYRAAIDAYKASYVTYEAEKTVCTRKVDEYILNECVPCIERKCEERAYNCLDDFSKFLVDTQTFFTDSLPDAFKPGVDGIENFFTSSIPSFGGTFFEGTVGLGVTIGEGTVDLGKKIGGGIVDFHTTIGEGAVDVGEDVGIAIGEGTVDLGKTIGEGTVDLGKTIGEGTVDLGKTIGEGTVDVGKTIGEGTVDVGKKIGEGTIDVGKKIGEGTVDLGKKIGEGLGGLLGRKRRAVLLARIRRDEANCNDLEKNPTDACLKAYQHSCPCEANLDTRKCAQKELQ